jgi:hypothetical protein
LLWEAEKDYADSVGLQSRSQRTSVVKFMRKTLPIPFSTTHLAIRVRLPTRGRPTLRAWGGQEERHPLRTRLRSGDDGSVVNVGHPRSGAPTNTAGAVWSMEGTGLRYVPVNHSGNQSDSPEEVERIVEIVRELLRGGATWTNKEGEALPLELKDILIVAPYNVQVSALKEALPGARIGTVDKFQGQQAPIVFYSTATSTPEGAPRGMEFLYSLNRLNVATSRSQCVTILVASPALFQVQCKTPRQIELANAFCRYLEMAQV